ncbi:MAG: GDP-L-fucose synthase [Phycisphaerae bacterium]|nr:MAG: GDP-L-fucose synthase [Planctomycetota bacterium]KAB2949562.1 MAG: GDP-L-fucose synthase [Phycisphaerae bacterium]MBE7455842.1 GDP-L-fucose synthase [Planctomycetia bacterium]MCK6463477.1 GDP-L-fucose synthase [Phycisphaerae bacterium]MCL4717100.1 GDP-L-fucose synthase [Phycisphaerae bacterium]
MNPRWANLRVCVTGGAGFLGRAVCRRLEALQPRALIIPRRKEYDLTHTGDAERLIRDTRPDLVVHLAAEVGGIGANRERPGRFFYANMMMGVNLIESARRHGVGKFVQIGTVCAYPKHCPPPFREEDLWSGFPEETNAPYGVAKRALLTMLQAYRAEYGFKGVYLLPVNLYGPGDNFDPRTSHVIPALIRRFSEASARGASEVVCWGTGTASREFLYVDDAAEGIVRACEVYDDGEPINLGTGREVTVAELAAMIARILGYSGSIRWDGTMPDGQPRRQLDVSRAKARLDWRARTPLERGLERTVAWWRANEQRIAAAGAARGG